MRTRYVTLRVTPVFVDIEYSPNEFSSMSTKRNSWMSKIIKTNSVRCRGKASRVSWGKALTHIFKDKINKENPTVLRAITVYGISVKYLTISDANSNSRITVSWYLRVRTDIPFTIAPRIRWYSVSVRSVSSSFRYSWSVVWTLDCHIVLSLISLMHRRPIFDFLQWVNRERERERPTPNSLIHRTYWRLWEDKSPKLRNEIDRRNRICSDTNDLEKTQMMKTKVKILWQLDDVNSNSCQWMDS